MRGNPDEFPFEGAPPRGGRFCQTPPGVRAGVPPDGEGKDRNDAYLRTKDGQARINGELTRDRYEKGGGVISSTEKRKDRTHRSNGKYVGGKSSRSTAGSWHHRVKRACNTGRGREKICSGLSHKKGRLLKLGGGKEEGGVYPTGWNKCPDSRKKAFLV